MTSQEEQIGSPKIATLQLCGCSGCHISILDISQNLFNLIDNGRIELKHMQILMDVKTLEEPIDILLVEGCVLTQHDQDILEKYAKYSQKIVAVGSCSSFGGPAALGNRFHRRDVLRKMYPDSNPSGKSRVPTHDLPAVHEFACPIDTFVKVDLFIPGCPPEPITLRDFITGIIDGKGTFPNVKTVCDECPRKRTGESPSQIRRIIEIGKIDPDKCLVEQGIVCMGKMTMAGCGAKCPGAGAPCEGCYGPNMTFRDVSPMDAPTIRDSWEKRNFA
jgi:F420-non-reducing hydrogenase small subunit